MNEREPKKAKFADLTRDRQESLLTNSIALAEAVVLLSDLTGEPTEKFALKLAQIANEKCDRLNDLQVAKLIAAKDAEFE